MAGGFTIVTVRLSPGGFICPARRSRGGVCSPLCWSLPSSCRSSSRSGARGRPRRSCSSRSTSRARATTRPSRSTTAPVRRSNLAAGNYSVQMCFNGNAACALTIPLTGTVAAGDVFVLAQSAAGAADPRAGRPDERRRLVQRRRRRRPAEGRDDHRRDRPGRLRPRHRMGHRPHEHGRQHAAAQGDDRGRRLEPDATSSIRPSSGTASRPTTSPGLGAHSTVVADAAPQVDARPRRPPARPASRPRPTCPVTFSEPVSVTGSWFTISCALSGAHTADRERRADDVHPQPRRRLRARRDLHGHDRWPRRSPTRTRTTRRTRWRRTSPGRSRPSAGAAHPRDPGRRAPLAARGPGGRGRARASSRPRSRTASSSRIRRRTATGDLRGALRLHVGRAARRRRRRRAGRRLRDRVPARRRDRRPT